MSFRLNGWQRLGIVASILWAVVSFVYLRWTDSEVQSYRQTTPYKPCSWHDDSQNHDLDPNKFDYYADEHGRQYSFSKGSSEADALASIREQYPKRKVMHLTKFGVRCDDEKAEVAQWRNEFSFQNTWEREVAVSVMRIPIAWLLVYMFIGLWRWVKRGFSVSP